jgi:hypothetical protein
MEPRQDEKKDKEPRSEAKEEKPRRFHIIKLEERIAPGGHNSKHSHCAGGCC